MINYIRNVVNSQNRYGTPIMVKPIHMNSVENIKEVLSGVDLGKNIVCACEDGDKAISMYLYGAENVAVYTNNILELILIELKLAAIKNLSYEEFCTFFCYRLQNHAINFQILKEDLFRKMTSSLNNEIINIMNCFYSRNSGVNIRTSELFLNGELDLGELEESNPLYNEKDFNRLKELLTTRRVSVIIGDISEVINRISYVNNIFMASSEQDSYTEQDYLDYLAAIKEKCGELIANYIKDYRGCASEVIHPIKAARQISCNQRDAILVLN